MQVLRPAERQNFNNKLTIISTNYTARACSSAQRVKLWITKCWEVGTRWVETRQQAAARGLAHTSVGSRVKRSSGLRTADFMPGQPHLYGRSRRYTPDRRWIRASLEALQANRQYHPIPGSRNHLWREKHQSWLLKLEQRVLFSVGHGVAWLQALTRAVLLHLCKD